MTPLRPVRDLLERASDAKEPGIRSCASEEIGDEGSAVLAEDGLGVKLHAMNGTIAMRDPLHDAVVAARGDAERVWNRRRVQTERVVARRGERQRQAGEDPAS